MIKLVEIVKAFDRIAAAGKAGALATVVHVEGSSYRRPGARMLVDEDGLVTGAISGGCLEGDALRKALQAMHQQEPRLVTYDTSDEDDSRFGVQLGCSGVIQVLFEPVDPQDPYNPIAFLRKAIAGREPALLVTVFDLTDRKKTKQAGTLALINAMGEVFIRDAFHPYKEAFLSEMQVSLSVKASRFLSLSEKGSHLHFFVEYLAPPIRLVIAGAGNDAVPLMKMADALGWEVRIVDGRGNLVRSDRFASACQLLVSKPEEVLEQIPVDAKTAFVMMTHNYNYDLALMKALLPLDLLYIGLLGPQKKLQRILEELASGGMQMQPSWMEKVHGPTGLDIGAESPEEIALSILSEILAVDRKKNGGQLKHLQGFIHDREPARFKSIGG